jgi:hypothetical protein
MMIRGFRTMSGRAALAATAGLLMGAYASAPARAADLGGGCCADLEERVAELEATTARKGNRIVSLQVYGQVNKALLIWDDGVDSDAYIVDNDYSGTRVGFAGSAAMKPGWKAGFNVELDIQDSASDKVFNSRFGNGSASRAGEGDEGTTSTITGIRGENEIVIRYSNVYVESDRIGRVTLGQQSTASDGAAEVVLGNSLSYASISTGNDFIIQGTPGSGVIGGSGGTRVDSFVASFDGIRDDVIRYDSPAIYGFILSASWGDDDYWDVTLRYKNEWNSVRIAAAIAYQMDDTNDDANTLIDQAGGGAADILLGSISVMHIPTGIYGAFAAGTIDKDDIGGEANFWYAQLGLERKFLSYGSTTIYGEYGQYDDVATLRTVGDYDSSEADRWGFGVVQRFDSAALELYLQASFWSFDAVTSSGVALDLEDLSTVMLGSRIKF